MTSLTYINQKIINTEEAKIPITSLAFTLGGSVFEALRANWNPNKEFYYLPNIKKNINRLFDSMKILRMTIAESKEDLLKIIISLIKEWGENTDAYIRVTAYISDSSSSGSVYLPSEVNTKIAVTITEKSWEHSITQSIKCQTSTWQRISDSSMPPRVKSAANYENTRLAGQEARLNGFDNAIMMNNFGKISEAAESAIFFIDKNNKLITPSLQSDVLDSINRQAIMYIWKKMTGEKVIERIVDRSELYLAEEMFLINTAKLIRPVTSLDHIQIGNGSIGIQTREIANIYNKSLRGDNDFFNDSSIRIKED